MGYTGSCLSLRNCSHVRCRCVTPWRVSSSSSLRLRVRFGESNRGWVSPVSWPGAIAQAVLDLKNRNKIHLLTNLHKITPTPTLYVEYTQFWSWISDHVPNPMNDVMHWSRPLLRIYLDQNKDSYSSLQICFNALIALIRCNSSTELQVPLDYQFTFLLFFIIGGPSG